MFVIWFAGSPASLHPPFVHRSWPRSFVQRFKRLTSDPAIARRDMDSFICRLELHGNTALRNNERHRSPLTTSSGSSARLVIPFCDQLGGSGLYRLLQKLSDALDLRCTVAWTPHCAETQGYGLAVTQGEGTSWTRFSVGWLAGAAEVSPVFLLYFCMMWLFVLRTAKPQQQQQQAVVHREQSGYRKSLCSSPSL